jgi:hypothetical protein
MLLGLLGITVAISHQAFWGDDVPNAEEIIKLVEAKRLSTHALRDRMASDFLMWILKEFSWDETVDHGEDGPFKTYTSNEPRAYADKIISYLVGARLLAQVPDGGNDRSDRDDDLARERFVMGVLEQADDNLRMMVEPPVREQLAWFAAVRGWLAGRVVFVKDKDEDGNESTSVDITPWDPLYTYWEVGGRRGLKWACHVTRKTREEIMAEWSIEIDPKDEEPSIFEGHRQSDDSFDVYDYFDDENNIVVVETGAELKKETKHGAPRTPCFIIPVGAMPYIQSGDGHEGIEHVGESVFAANRELYEKVNEVLSTWFELVSRSKNPPIAFESESGDKTLEENPWQAGSEIALARGEKISSLDLLEMSKDTGALFGLISSELQRGGIPNVAFGELQFQLSGFAIGNLGNNIEGVLQGRIRAMRDAYKMMCDLAVDTFGSGKYKSIELSGRTRGRDYFSETITPEQVKKGGRMVYELVPILPQDDMQKWTIAQIAQKAEMAPDRWIRENILQMSDSDGITDLMLTQRAERGLPQAQMFILMEAAARAGQEQIAKFYFEELLKTMHKAMNPTPDMGGPGVPGGPPPGAPGVGGMPPGIDPMAMLAGIDPSVLTPAALGVPPTPPDASQLGGMVAPGSPRPGAQLVGPDGVTPLL